MKFHFTIRDLLLALAPLAIGFALVREFFRVGQLNNLLVLFLLLTFGLGSVALGWLLDRGKWTERSIAIGVASFCLVGAGGALAMFVIVIGRCSFR